MNVIEFDNVSKSFHRAAGRHLLRNYIVGLFGKKTPDPFYAVRNVSFKIKAGETVGVVGSNGAGKSTLLSLVTGLTPPCAGRIEVNGRVAALLELGCGFHPDLTGRENVMLNASLLGFKRRRAEELYDSIIDFAEMQEFIEEPLRTYSTGMHLRLAFAVAVNLDPEVLIIDEVLSVGDRAFQEKCIDKIFEIKQQGKTILAVSHAAGAIQHLCDRALWMDHGELVMDGDCREVLQAYEGHSTSAKA
jgi:ABC-type polysaccharide/polyol phosphate transport system ATPase subunit